MLLSGCASAAQPATAPATPVNPPPVVDAAATATVAPVAIVHTVVVTATPVPATSTPVAGPAVKLLRNTPAGRCRWDVYMALTGFAPDSRITVTSNFSEVVCLTGEVVNNATWTEVYHTPTNASGRLVIGYLHEATGDYHYSFIDEQGNFASLEFSTEPDPTWTPSAQRTATASPVPAPTVTAAPDPMVIVKSATLNLRSGPGQNYPVVGQVEQGDRLYPVARVGACTWLQVGVLGQADLAWVAGGTQFVTLNVPCETLWVQEQIPPTPLPAPTAAPRPATGLLSRTGSYGAGALLIRNGTDGDGMVILVTVLGNPVQAAYIRAGDSFEMTGIADGNYELYFMKGDGWDANNRQFLRNITRQRFTDPLPFGPDNPGWEVTLYGVANGNAGTQGVSPGEFPAAP